MLKLSIISPKAHPTGLVGVLVAIRTLVRAIRDMQKRKRPGKKDLL